MKRTAIAAVIIMGLASAAFAQITVPSMINYQGLLRDDAGAAVTSGAYIIEFRIWDHGTGGDVLWGREYPVHVMDDGMFNVVLGDGGGDLTPAVTNALESAFDGEERYLGLTVIDTPSGAVTDPQEISPRQRLLSAPYALRSYETDHADELGDNVAYAAGSSMIVLGALTVSNSMTVGGDITVSSAHSINAKTYTVTDGTLTYGSMEGGSGTLGQGVAAQFTRITGSNADLELRTTTAGNVSLYAKDNVVIDSVDGVTQIKGPVKALGAWSVLKTWTDSSSTGHIDGHAASDGFLLVDVHSARVRVEVGSTVNVENRSIDDDDDNYGSHLYPVAYGEYYKVTYEENLPDGSTHVEVYWRPFGF